jgi:hypothetical protein
VGPRAGLVAVVKRKIPSHCRKSKPRSSSPQPSAITLSYPGSSCDKMMMMMMMMMMMIIIIVENVF